jgi:hypothetical protein
VRLITRIRICLSLFNSNTSTLRFWLLWVSANTLVLGLGFGLVCWWYVQFSGYPNPYVGLLDLPIDQPKGLILIDLVLCLVQLPFLCQFRWRRASITWIWVMWSLSSFFRLFVASFIRSYTFAIFALMSPYSHLTIEEEYLIGAITSGIGGLIAGGLTGLIEVWIMPTRKRWVVISALAWALAWALGWVVMAYISNVVLYNSIFIPAWVGMGTRKAIRIYGMHMQPEGFVLDLPYKLAIYGGVIGLVSSAITGIGLLTCFPRRDRTSL